MILYHGTSERRLDTIRTENRLTATGLSPAVCMSTRIGPAKYWANISAWTDTCEPFVLRLMAKPLLEAGFTLMPFSDPVWGRGECDWEREVRVEEDIHPLSDFLKRFDRVPWDADLKNCPRNIRSRA